LICQAVIRRNKTNQFKVLFEYEQEQLLFGREIIADPKRIALWWMPEG
jgi:hypothetical protein